MKYSILIPLLIFISFSCRKSETTISEELIGEWEWTHTTFEYSTVNGWGSVSYFYYILDKDNMNYTARFKVFKSGKIHFYKDNIHYYTLNSEINGLLNVKFLSDSNNVVMSKDSLTAVGFPISIYTDENLGYTISPEFVGGYEFETFPIIRNYFKKK
jgi:hypothetical protein